MEQPYNNFTEPNLDDKRLIEQPTPALPYTSRGCTQTPRPGPSQGELI